MLPIDHRPPPPVVPCLAPAECAPGRAAEVVADAGAVARLCKATAAERANAIFFTEHSAPAVAPAERCGRCCEILACDDDESCRVRFHADGAVLWLPRAALRLVSPAQVGKPPGWPRRWASVSPFVAVLRAGMRGPTCICGADLTPRLPRPPRGRRPALAALRRGLPG